LIENGHLYIAQPPLFRAKRGQEERYLKDEPALDSYLLDKALSNAFLTCHDGTVLDGAELRDVIDRCSRLAQDMRALSARVPLWIMEQAAVSGLINPDAAIRQKAVDGFLARLEAASPENERGWEVEADSQGVTCRRFLRGVGERYTFEATLLRSSEARRLLAQSQWLAEFFSRPVTLQLDQKNFEFSGPGMMMEQILAQGRRGLAINRFKGLGEMNDEQLWHTTLDPATRTLLQVQVGDVEEAGQVFSTLMGDVVEPRREFIVDNALKVANLDV
ncbi:MAG: DNA gyrase subunit B, partial [Bombella apis]|nr:DNA gyrase subunit B [Bombella apis]